MSDFSTIDRLLQGFVDGGLPGCAMEIAKDGETLYRGFFGYADLEKKLPVTESSVFRLASMSKLSLVTVMMMLYERGKFLLTDPVYSILPEWEHTTKFVINPNGYQEIVPTKKAVTIGDVLSMKCGLPYCNFPGQADSETLRIMQQRMQPLWDRGHFTLREQLKAMADVPQLFEPGEHWLYGFSSEICAGIIEEVCGKSIDAVFEELLFEPLGMDSTRSHYFGDMKERMVQFYALGENGQPPSPCHTPLDDKHLPGKEHECGWARLFSTTGDFSRLMQMLACGGVYNGTRIMGRKTIDLLRTNTLTETMLREDFTNDYLAGYGYGYGMRTLMDPYAGHHNGSVGAFGWTGGSGTWAEADPAEGVSIVYMHNLQPNLEEYHHLRMRAVAYGCLQ